MKRSVVTLGLVFTILCSMALVAFAQEQVALEARVKPLLQVDGLQFKDLNNNGMLDPYEDRRLPNEERVDNLVSLMTLDEKAGTMIHPKKPIPLDGTVATEPVHLTL